MDALVMCGGLGTRLDADREKPLVEVSGVPMVDRVLAALRESEADRIRAVVSPRAPETARHLADRSADLVRAPGEGYVADLNDALETVRDDPADPVLTAVADLPLLAPAHVNRTLAAADGRSLTVCVPAALKRRLGVSADTTFERDGRELAPTGLNVVAGDADRVRVSDDSRLAVNVNRSRDLAVARDRCE